MAYTFFIGNPDQLTTDLGRDRLVAILREMLRIRHFERRAEAAYQEGKIGGFFHSYAGQEAIQTGVLAALGPQNWYITTYRCHALAILLGVSLEDIASEFFGRANGNAKGRGGSMHLYADRLLGGFGIVGGHVPVATGAAFSIKYRKIPNEVAVCFLGDGAVAQGAVHESLNLASLWNLPCIYVIENNKWGMGTGVERALSMKKIAEDLAPAYHMKGYTVDGTNFFDCYAAFHHLYQEVLATGRPVIIEALAERFRGHSISDPGLYRSKEALQEAMKKDPIAKLRSELSARALLSDAEFETMDKEAREAAAKALEHAERSPWPDPIHLEEDVFAP